MIVEQMFCKIVEQMFYKVAGLGHRNNHINGKTKCERLQIEHGRIPRRTSILVSATLYHWLSTRFSGKWCRYEYFSGVDTIFLSLDTRDSGVDTFQ